MSTKKSISHIFPALLVLVSILALTFGALGVTPAWAFTVRYATPGGMDTGNCASWATACTLQTALTNAGSGDEIWVASGIHKPTTTTDRAATFQLKAVAVYGGFAGTETSRDQRDPVANVTILSGEIGAASTSDNSYHVVTSAAGTILDGFTITAGSANNGSGTGSFGGGMYNTTGNLTLTNIIFSGNLASNYGGGMYNGTGSPTLANVTFGGNSAKYGGGMYNDTGSPTLMNVTFSSNSATSYGGGMYSNANGSPMLTNVTFSGNSAGIDGGAIFSDASSPTLTNVSFNGNSATTSGGGMYNNLSSNPTLTNVTFSGNWAHSYGGGMSNYSSNPVLANVTFSGNWATQGGGMYNTYSSPTLTNVTFDGNAATNGGGMYNASSSNPTIRNTIFWDNIALSSGPQIYGGNLIVSDSVVQGGCPAGSTCTNLIITSPMLGPISNYGGYSQTIPLLAGSSAIDAGNNATCALTDQRGYARPIDGDGNGSAICDIGAYEAGAIPLPTNTPTPTAISTNTPTPTAISTNTPTPTDVSANTPTSTAISANTPTPTPTQTATRTVTSTPIRTPTPITQTFISTAAQDGWVLESAETGSVGGSMNATATIFYLGDDAAKKQYRGILSFNTGAILPDNAVITGVTLKVKQQAIVGGGNPVAIFQGFMVDIKNGLFGTAALQTGDFQAAASASYGPFTTALSGGWYSINLIGAGPFANKLATGSGLTQIRLRFKLDDNNNTIANYLSLYSGNAPAGSQPQLVIVYYVP